MLHPFSGVSRIAEEAAEAQPSRRQALGTMIFAAGVVAVPALAHGQIAVTNAVGEQGVIQATTLALGEEGAVTAALREQGGVANLPPVTTEPFGEEAGKVTSRMQPGLEDGGAVVRPPINQPVTQAIPEEGRATTLALGEEGNRPVPPPAATTDALNEEGGEVPAQPPARLTRALNEQGAAAPGQAGQAVAGVAIAQIAVAEVVTTEAVGEEGAQQVKPVQVQIQPAQIQITTQAVGEEAATGALNEAGVTTRAVGEEGAMTKALNEAGGIALGQVVQVKPMSRDLTDAQLKAVWGDLGASDPGKGLQAAAVLYGSKQALSFLKDNLKFETPKVDAAQLAKLVKELDSDEFETRENAEKALEKLGMAALAALQAAIDDKATSMEVKMRAQRLVAKFKDNSPILQAQRGVEVLVALNTPEAKALIETIAKGPDGDLVVPVAKKALERIQK